MGFDSIDAAIQDIAAGRMVIVVDDEDRENEGDLVMAAEKATPQAINFMATYGRGLICLPMTQEKLNRLGLDKMVENNTDQLHTDFTESIDAIDTRIGISAYERAQTIQRAIADEAGPTDFKKPGHVFPLIAREGGVLKRAGHTEAAVDLARLANLKPAGVICEILKDDGTMARVPDLLEYAKQHGLKIVTIADLISYRRRQDTYVRLADSARLPTEHGEFRVYGYENTLSGEHHVALVKGDIASDEDVLVRVHSECLTGDAFSSQRCDCGEQLNAAMAKVQQAGRGVILYMRQEGRGIGLINKIRAYRLQDQGLDTVEANEALGFDADLRDYGIGAQILADLGVSRIRLMTNNPQKLHGLRGHGLKIVERMPIQMNHNERNEHYLKTKKEKLGHMLEFKEDENK